jgi:hypothetical protein
LQLIRICIIVETMNARPPFPAETEALDQTDRLVAWMFRHWVIGHSDDRHWSLVWREIADSYGRECASEAVTALASLVRVICENARRGFVYHQPCCPCLAADEYRLIAFLGACRAGEARRAAGLAEWIVRAEGIADLIEAGSRLVRTMGSARAQPADQGDDAPDGLDHAERPRALEEAVDRA